MSKDWSIPRPVPPLDGKTASQARNDGGPAFPVPGLSGLPNGEFLYPIAGMTLRDYFAAQALDPLIAGRRCYLNDGARIREWATISYMIADAMLVAREAS